MNDRRVANRLYPYRAFVMTVFLLNITYREGKYCVQIYNTSIQHNPNIIHRQRKKISFDYENSILVSILNKVYHTKNLLISTQVRSNVLSALGFANRFTLVSSMYNQLITARIVLTTLMFRFVCDTCLFVVIHLKFCKRKMCKLINDITLMTIGCRKYLLDTR